MQRASPVQRTEHRPTALPYCRLCLSLPGCLDMIQGIAVHHIVVHCSQYCQASQRAEPHPRLRCFRVQAVVREVVQAVRVPAVVGGRCGGIAGGSSGGGDRTQAGRGAGAAAGCGGGSAGGAATGLHTRLGAGRGARLRGRLCGGIAYWGHAGVLTWLGTRLTTGLHTRL